MCSLFALKMSACQCLLCLENDAARELQNGQHVLRGNRQNKENEAFSLQKENAGSSFGDSDPRLTCDG